MRRAGAVGQADVVPDGPFDLVVTVALGPTPATELLTTQVAAVVQDRWHVQRDPSHKTGNHDALRDVADVPEHTSP